MYKVHLPYAWSVCVRMVLDAMKILLRGMSVGLPEVLCGY